MIIIYFTLIVAALFGVAILFFKGIPTLIAFLDKRSEVKRKHKESLAVIAQMKDVLTLLTYKEELGKKVRIGLERHESEPNWWLDEGEERLKNEN